MSKIVLKDVGENQTRWFCECCGKHIEYVLENIFSRPLIDSCPHCGVMFSGYELCDTRRKFQSRLYGEFPELGEAAKKQSM